MSGARLLAFIAVISGNERALDLEVPAELARKLPDWHCSREAKNL